MPYYAAANVTSEVTLNQILFLWDKISADSQTHDQYGWEIEANETDMLDGESNIRYTYIDYS